MSIIDPIIVPDPYFVLSDVADALWDLHQSTIHENPKASEQARSMYETLENVYLEPIRRAKVREDTAKYASIAQDLKSETKSIDEQIKRIDNIVETVQKVSEYAKIFDQVVAAAAKFLAFL
jgi:hemerythrin-like domain-containing protein